ncbi:MAG TPA: hypothetical protein VNE00_15235 [Paraburkholderia sp.]|nr:hypothetical protein [Paraburkholderia sp.]
MNINTRAASMPMQDYAQAPASTPQTGGVQQAAAPAGPIALPEPDPKPAYYGHTVKVSAEYYPDNKTPKSESMSDENGNSVTYDFDETGRRAHESDVQVREHRILVSTQQYDYDRSGKRVRTNPEFTAY